MQKYEKKIKMYIFKTCGAICENFVRAQFLRASVINEDIFLVGDMASLHKCLQFYK